MEDIPKRTSLVAQTVAILREGIQSGVWRDLLPGELELCERFRVSRVTLRAALDQLRREGWFRGGQGRRREIMRDRVATATAPPSDRVVLLSPRPLQNIPGTAMFWVDALRDHLAATGYRLDFHASQGCYSQHPERSLETLIRKLRPAGCVLYLSTAPMQQWFSDRGLPCVISGSRHPGVQLSSVDVDYAACCRHAVGLLAARKRRRLALLMPRGTSAGDLESERGFTEAGQQLAAQSMRTVIARHDGSVPAICRTLDGLLGGADPVDGILVAKPAHVVTAVSHLLRRGVRVPQAVSLISRDDDPLLENLVPTVARYHTDPALFARKVSRLVVDLVRNGVRLQHDSRLVPTLVPGETLS